jgi:hypothetical protein
VAGSIAVPLNVATKDDIKVAVEELKKWAEEKFATKEDVEQLKAEIRRLKGIMAPKEEAHREQYGH